MEVRGDGNCFYSAALVSAKAEGIDLKGVDGHMDLRRQMADYVRENYDTVFPRDFDFGEIRNMDRNRDRTSIVTSIGTDRKWTDNQVEPIVLGLMLGNDRNLVNIIFDRQTNPEQGYVRGRINLFFTGPPGKELNHYDAVICNDDNDDAARAEKVASLAQNSLRKNLVAETQQRKELEARKAREAERGKIPMSPLYERMRRRMRLGEFRQPLTATSASPPGPRQGFSRRARLARLAKSRSLLEGTATHMSDDIAPLLSELREALAGLRERVEADASPGTLRMPLAPGVARNHYLVTGGEGGRARDVGVGGTRLLAAPGLIG